MLNFLDSEDKVLRAYWVHTSSNELLQKIIFAHGLGQDGELETLLQGGEIDKVINDWVALSELDVNPEAVWSFLLFTGYLKADRVRQENDETVASLSIPNREVLTVYRTIFRTWLEQRLGGPRPVEELQEAILVRSNRESGSGRYDVMILPRTPGQPGVVMELKVKSRRRRETMKGAVAAALKQTRERDYAAELRACGASPIHEMGVVFDGKQVRVGIAPARRGGARGRPD